jgi:iron complex outermembrane recepter protein
MLRGITPHTAVALAVATFPIFTSAKESAALEEIIVTAQKRSQSVQDVPIAITAYSQQMLENQNIFDALDLQRAVPSVTIAMGYNRANGVPMVIRGMGTVGTQPAFEGSVGTYVDGIYRSRPGMVLSSMLDIGQVEILRGPQGTLFGKNTTSGALTMTSNAPAEVFGYGGELTLGDFDRQRFSGHITGPLGDSVRARLALLSDQRDGFTEALYLHDDYGDLDTQAAKLSLQWLVNDQLDVKLIADYSDSNEVCCFGNPVPYNRASSLTGGPFQDYYREAAQANFNTDVDLMALDPDDRETQNNVQPSNDNTEKGLLVDIKWQLEFAELRSLSGYRNWQYNSRGDFDFGPVDIGELEEDYDVDSYSQEFNLTGSVGESGFIQGLEYVAGLYYAHEEFEQYRAFDAGHDQAGIWELFWPQQASLPESLLRNLLGGGAWATVGEPIGKVDHKLESDTVAAYAHITAALTDKYSVILGLRYSDEEKTLDRRNLLFADVSDYSSYMQEFMLGGYMLGANIAGPDINGKSYSDSEWTYDLKIQYFLSSDIQLYGGYSRGFKAGGIGMDPEAGGGQPSGLNSPQLFALAGIGNGTGFADPEEITYDPEYVDTWEVGMKSDYLDGRARTNLALFYNDIEDIQFAIFTGTGFRVLNASTAEVTGIEVENFFAVTPNLHLGASVTWLDTEYGDDIPPPAASGRELTLAPEWAAALNMEYERPLTAALAGFVNANWAYHGEQHLAYDIQDQHDDYSLLGLQLGIRTTDGRWDARVWCDNCLDETYATTYFNAPFYFDDNLKQYQNQFLGPPRTYGVTLRANF